MFVRRVAEVEVWTQTKVLSPYINMQICNDLQKRRICRENSKYAPDENFVAFFAFAERLLTFALPP